ncbi:MAG: diguanylate cyclase protein [Geminicoccaceae bacterium]|nr:diguanylate cyclase protein [Geminicoccaceae bacterium]
MTDSLNDKAPESADLAHLALSVVDHVPAMLAYWNTEQVCRFANEAYRSWFGKSRAQVVGSTMRELLGPIYELNLPYIRGALAGQAQIFERTIPGPDGVIRESLATYLPDITDGVVRGFFVHVADVTAMKKLERELAAALREVRTLRGLLPICMYCKQIRDPEGKWSSVEAYVRARADVEFSHGICPQCLVKHYPDYAP